jgi:hypothetical protein
MNDIIADIEREMLNQQEKHPNFVKYFLHPSKAPCSDAIGKASEAIKKINNELAAKGEESLYGVVIEELFEVFVETDKTKIRAEMVQNAALWIRSIIALDGGMFINE